METRNQYFNIESGKTLAHAERERGYFYLPEEKSTSNGSGFQFVKKRELRCKFFAAEFCFFAPTPIIAMRRARCLR